MKTFIDYILSEADAPASPPTGTPPLGGDPMGGLGAPGPAGLGSNPMPPIGGGGMPPSIGGNDPMNMGGGGGPQAGGSLQPPVKYKTSNVWDVLEKILDHKKIGIEKEVELSKAN